MISTALDISKALQIDGWMEEPELLWLAEQAQKYACIVELGSFLGRSTRALGDNTSGFVIAIDDWYGPREIIIAEDVRAGFLNTFTQNNEDLIRSGRVRPVIADHGGLENIAGDIRPDMVFIDGDHTYEGAKRDIEFWKPRIKPRGLLCGHDAHDAYVSAAVIDLCEGAGLVTNTNIWAVYV